VRTRLITFVTKLTAFEFRWARDGEGGAGAGVAGVKELVFVTPCREYEGCGCFPLDEKDGGLM